MNFVIAQAAIFERVTVVVGLFEVAAGKVVGVDNNFAAGLQVREIGFEGGRIHRHQHLGRVAGGQDVGAGKINLEAAHSGQGAGWGANFSRKVRHGADIIAKNSSRVAELSPGQLHSVARVAGKTDNDRINIFKYNIFGLCHPKFLLK